MDAGTHPIRVIFGQDRRHIVPLFQRRYVWKKESQWEPLWEDIRNVAVRLTDQVETRPHFLGAVVLDQLRKPTGSVETRLIIDGQQRLTTIQVLLEALCDLCATLGAEKYHKALLKLTRNDDPMSDNADDRFKVWPTNRDQEDFRRVMDAGSPADLLALYGVKDPTKGVGQPIADAYLYFYEAVKDWVRPGENGMEGRLEILYQTLREKLRMVVIDLSTDDDAQLIFETLNARGTPLLPSDLVKNFLFHRVELAHEPLEPLYAQYWEQFDLESAYWGEELGRGHARRARIDLFLQHYLTVKTADEVPVGHLYSAYRQYAAGEGSPKVQLSSIHAYARVYQSFDNLAPDTREGRFFSRLSAMDIGTALPFLLEVTIRLKDHKALLTRVLEDVESFLVRRMIVQLNTRGYNRLFIDLLQQLEGEVREAHARTREFLLAGDNESNRWPKDDEFRAAWIEVAAYRVLVRQRVRMVLEAVEQQIRSEKSEKIELKEKLTIEHVLPQQWRTHWPLPEGAGEDAAARRSHLIDTFGNLTLLTRKLNPSVSNGPWADKKKAIQKHSALALNRDFPDEAAWDEGTILQRGRELFSHARKIWRHPG